MEDKQYKKFYRKADKHLNGKIEAEHGKRNNHKMKPYFVLQYLLKNSDANHTKSAYDIPLQYRHAIFITHFLHMTPNTCSIDF